MLAALVILVATGILTGIVAALGAGLFALIVIPVGIALAIWLAIAGRARQTPRDLARNANEGEFFGPGGPDDPTR
ncbi:MAG: hypothetical protein M3123_04890 [Actinomycetota bacterium]|nr:hypothetical protein [Actinomycetota bacterium]